MMEKEEKVDSLTKLYNEEQIDYLFHLAIANHRFLLQHPKAPWGFCQG